MASGRFVLLTLLTWRVRCVSGVMCVTLSGWLGG